MTKKRLPLLETQHAKIKEMLPLQSGFGAAKQFVTFSVNGSTSPARKKTQFQPPIRESHRRMPNPNFPSTTDGQFETQTAENSGGSANSSQKRAAVVENVFCPPSKLQKQLYNSVHFLMTMRESEQHKLLRLLCNHPILLYQRVLELSGDLQHQATKRAKKEFINFSGVMCHFPTRYELSECRIQDSGKLIKLFEMVTKRPTDRLIIASNYVKTLDMLDALFGLLREHFTVFRINSNTPVTVLPQIERQTLEGSEGQHKIILLSSKMERLSAELFHSSRLVFYDFDPTTDVRTFSKWHADGMLQSVQRLVTLETFEADEFSSTDGSDSRPNSQPFDLLL